MRYNFDRRKGQVYTTFFDGGRTNICYNALDRHVEQGRGSQPCFLWEVSLACSGGSGSVTLSGIPLLQRNWVRYPGLPGVEISAWSVQHSSDEGPPARLQGNDIGDDRVMTFSEARDEVSRLVSPLPGDLTLAKGCSIVSVPEWPPAYTRRSAWQ